MGSVNPYNVVGGAASGAAAGTQIAPGWGTAIGAGVGGLTGILGGLFGSGGPSDQEKAAMAEQNRIKAFYESMLTGKPVQYKDYDGNSLGFVDASSMNGSQLMPSFGRMDEALAKLKTLSETGMTAQDQQGYAQARLAGNQAAQGRERAIRDRVLTSGGGAGSSGQMAALEAQAGQGAMERTSAQDMATAADASNRRATSAAQYLGGLGVENSQELANANAIRDFNLKALAGMSGQTDKGLGNAEAINEMQTQNRSGNAIDFSTLAPMVGKVKDWFGGGGMPTANSQPVSADPGYMGAETPVMPAALSSSFDPARIDDSDQQKPFKNTTTRS